MVNQLYTCFSDEVLLMCKGAESAMLDRAVNGDSITTLQHINEYAMVRSCNFHLFECLCGLRKAYT